MPACLIHFRKMQRNLICRNNVREKARNVYAKVNTTTRREVLSAYANASCGACTSYQSFFFYHFHFAACFAFSFFFFSHASCKKYVTMLTYNTIDKHEMASYHFSLCKLRNYIEMLSRFQEKPIDRIKFLYRCTRL
ncbi:hypothetical protein PUN28_007785 [Cardiocondyla obscurior]|uniref:Uncharacterized protein n=1 Tax=Cardiocondyla obscurior TaxID=286306 RepID=A0AAW2FUB1_9HYME